MAIYIKGAYKPVNCQLCIKIRLANAIGCKARENTTSLQRAFSIPEDCPITQIHEPHGRLIDVDVLLEESKKDGAFNYVDSWQIADAPTVIEGSE